MISYFIKYNTLILTLPLMWCCWTPRASRSCCNFLPALQYSSWIFPSSIASRMKWCLTEMCLVWLWKTGFLAIEIANLLSQWITTCSCYSRKSFKISLIACWVSGKLELIWSILLGVECFWLSLLPLPLGIIDKLYAIRSIFVWNSKHPLSWQSLC